MPMDNALQRLVEQFNDHELRIRVLEQGVSEPKMRSPQATKLAENSDIVLEITNKIGDCQENESIQKKVLDQRNPQNKIMLCFYISSKYFGNTWLTSGKIEKITSQLGVKINIAQISRSLVKLRSYLESAASRRNGQPTPYRLNRNGLKYFETILNET